MKNCIFPFALLLPLIASAHPGHLALDPAAGLPHPGHELEIAPFLLLGVVAAAAWRFLRSAR
jgi:hypothetical protein